MKKLSAQEIRSELRSLANLNQATKLAWFFKTAKGEYGEGDKFLGIKVPVLRTIAREYAALPLSEIEKLAKSKFHEERFTAIVILTNQYKKAKSTIEKKKIFDLYVKLIDSGAVNNWDLVDVSAPYIGQYLLEMRNPSDFLRKFGLKDELWRERASIMFTFAFIRAGETHVAFDVVEGFLSHKHDLIHKAAGWMLREAGKRDSSGLKSFLATHASQMPRTMLRYSIEKLSEQERRRWLSQSGD